MGDSVFHIVEKNGQLELVQLVKVKAQANRINHDFCRKSGKEQCECFTCHPKLQNQPSSGLHKTTIKCKIKNFPNRAKSDNDFGEEITNITHIFNEKSKFKNEEKGEPLIDPLLVIKTEPGIDIIDMDDFEPSKNCISFETPKNDQQSVNTREVQADDPINVSIAQSKHNEEELPRGLPLLDQSDTSNDNVSFILSRRDQTEILQFSLKKIKCNICDIIFLDTPNQQNALRTHFLEHKNSINKVKKYTGINYQYKSHKSKTEIKKENEKSHIGLVATDGEEYSQEENILPIRINCNQNYKDDLPSDFNSLQLEKLLPSQYEDKIKLPTHSFQTRSKKRTSVPHIEDNLLRNCLPQAGTNLISQEKAESLIKNQKKKNGAKTQSPPKLWLPRNGNKTQQLQPRSFKVGDTSIELKKVIRLKRIKLSKTHLSQAHQIDRYFGNSQLTMEGERDIKTNSITVKSFAADDDNIESARDNSEQDDDDIQIVEQKPDLIVIDDNDML